MTLSIQTTMLTSRIVFESLLVIHNCTCNLFLQLENRCRNGSTNLVRSITHGYPAM